MFSIRRVTLGPLSWWDNYLLGQFIQLCIKNNHNTIKPVFSSLLKVLLLRGQLSQRCLKYCLKAQDLAVRGEIFADLHYYGDESLWESLNIDKLLRSERAFLIKLKNLIIKHVDKCENRFITAQDFHSLCHQSWRTLDPLQNRLSEDVARLEEIVEVSAQSDKEKQSIKRTQSFREKLKEKFEQRELASNQENLPPQLQWGKSESYYLLDKELGHLSSEQEKKNALALIDTVLKCGRSDFHRTAALVQLISQKSYHQAYQCFFRRLRLFGLVPFLTESSCTNLRFNPEKVRPINNILWVIAQKGEIKALTPNNLTSLCLRDEKELEIIEKMMEQKGFTLSECLQATAPPVIFSPKPRQPGSRPSIKF